MMRFTVGLLILLLASAPAHAFNAHGHKVISSIVVRQLTEAERTRLVAILKKHPRYAEDFEAKMPKKIADGDELGQQEWLLQQASIWPDIVRGFRGEDKKYNHPTWHYINQPHYLLDTDESALKDKLKINTNFDPTMTELEEQNVIQCIRRIRGTFRDPKTTDEEKAIGLAWVLHTIEDLHQPMHSTALFSEKLLPEGDKGGNLIVTKQGRNLHALWDGFLGEDESFASARNQAIKLLADEMLVKLGKESASDLDVTHWLAENNELARRVSYSPDLLRHLRERALANAGTEFPPMDFSEEYLKAGGEVSTRRAVQAGFRLGAVLKELVTD